MIRKSITAAFYKLCAMFGGLGTMPVIYILMACCFAAFAAAVGTPASERVSVAIFDECGGTHSRELVDAFASADGIDAVFVDSHAAGEDALLDGHAEVLISISPQYDELLTADEATALISIETAPGAVSAEIMREAAAGILLSHRSMLTARAELEADGFDSTKLDEYIDEYKLPSLYKVETIGGGSGQKPLFGTAYACYEGLAALVLLLLLLTLSRRLTDGASHTSAKKLYSARHGRAIAFTSDYLALWLAGAIGIPIIAVLAPDFSLSLMIGLICYVICIAGLSLFISRFGSAGRIDIAAPFIALVTSVAGGCFMDITMLSPALAAVARCTPQGQFIAAAGGRLLNAALLAAEGALFAVLSLIADRKSSRQ